MLSGSLIGDGCQSKAGSISVDSAAHMILKNGITGLLVLDPERCVVFCSSKGSEAAKPAHLSPITFAQLDEHSAFGAERRRFNSCTFLLAQVWFNV